MTKYLEMNTLLINNRMLITNWLTGNLKNKAKDTDRNVEHVH